MKKIRLSRKTFIVLGIGALVVLLGSLFMVYSRQSKERDGLTMSLTVARTQMTKLVTDKKSLDEQLANEQARLAEAEALLASTQAKFAKAGASVQYNEALSELAKSHRLRLVSMSAKEPRTKKVGGITFATISFDVGVSGDINGILSMVSDIASDERFQSVSLEGVDIKIPEPAEAGEIPELPSATIKLICYSYEET